MAPWWVTRVNDGPGRQGEEEEGLRIGRATERDTDPSVVIQVAAHNCAVPTGVSPPVEACSTPTESVGFGLGDTLEPGGTSGLRPIPGFAANADQRVARPTALVPTPP